MGAKERRQKRKPKKAAEKTFHPLGLFGAHKVDFLLVCNMVFSPFFIPIPATSMISQ
jgi:hypothetical protein